MARGRLRIFLGAVAGVGKTYAMLNEGRLRRDRGVDAVIGFVETHGRDETAAQVGDLEVVPRRRLVHRGTTFEEMDVDAILERAPQLCLVDELAHTNVPGSRNAKRWQDVVELLDAGIDVLSTLNIQHLESLNDVVEHITGVKQHETIPDEFVRSASEIQLVELTPEALRRRLAHGDIYPADRIDAALGNFFRSGNLGALRELALMWVADRVDENLHEYMAAKGIGESWETRERVLVAVTGAPAADRVIRRAARIASRVKGELLGVHVHTQDGLHRPVPTFLDDDRQLLEELGGRCLEVAGDDIPDALLGVARTHQVTQVVLGASRRSRWDELVRGSVIRDVMRNAGDIDVHVISTVAEQSTPHLPRTPPRLVGVSRRRRVLGFGLGLGGLAALTPVLWSLQDRLELSSVLLLYLTLVVATAAVGGAAPAAVAALGAFALSDFLFTEPYYTFTIDNPSVVVALLVFAAVTSMVSWLVAEAARRRAEADRAVAESGTLARLISTLPNTTDPVPQLLADLVATLHLDAAALLSGDHTRGWDVEAAAGSPVPRSPEDGSDAIQVSSDHVLVLTGPAAPAGEGRMLAAYAARVALALTAQQLRSVADDATAEARANELRASLLSAVSHDLRTPLASIKASASSLLSDDVIWTPDAVTTFATTIVAEADRLNTLITNLLDMSRIQAEAVRFELRPVALDEVLPNALKGLPPDADRAVIDIPGDLPAVLGDPLLVERIIANLVDNALRWSPDDEVVDLRASTNDGRVQLRIIDRGPGIPEELRRQVFEPFQRQGDQRNDQGVGLGLAVALGFADAMNGEILVEDTPGGGTTMVLELEAAR